MSNLSTSAKPVLHLGYIDAVRGLGVLGVLITHSCGQAGLVTGTLQKFLFKGSGGVQLFYVASAFTLCLSFSGRKTEAHPTRNFFLRRYLRIAPVFYVAMIISLVMNLARLPGHVPLLAPFDYVLGILLLHGLKVSAINTVTPGAWSVADESIFYIVLPFLVTVLTTIRRSAIAYVTAVVLCTAAGVALAHSTGDPMFYLIEWFPAELPVFLLGILAYHLWRRFLGSGARHLPRSAVLSIGLLLFGFALLRFHAAYWGPLVYGPFAFCFLLALMLRPWSLFVNPATRFLGKISYSVYLLHFFVIRLLSHFLFHVERSTPGADHGRFYAHPLGVGLYLLVLTCLTVPVATLSWLYIEEPFIRFGRRLIARYEPSSQPSRGPLVPPTHDIVSAFNTPDNQF